MKLSIGIVGLPNVGKSTLFKAITKIEVHVANYPFATIDPNVGIVPVPDERLQKLAAQSKSKKIVPAVVEFYDIAGLVKGASQGEGLGNQFLSHIREVSAIVQVLRCFPASEIIHVENEVNPLRDFEIINTELIMKDLETVEKRIKSAESEAKSGKREALTELELLKKVKAVLEKGDLLTAFRSEPVLRNFGLLTAKAMFCLLNGKEEDVPRVLKEKLAGLGFTYVCADLSVPDVDLGQVIREAYNVLNLISFLTTGEDETRAWTTVRGALAPEAAGVIHSDFEQKFIRAEVIHWEKLLEAARSTSSGQGAWSAAKAKGWLRIEGKDYAVADGDVMVIRHG